MTYDECVDYILSIPLFAEKLGTENLSLILELMGNPEKEYKIIHVAGTNGKGSTCSFLASILQKAGFKVGLFTSPHLVRINERIKLDNKDISNEEFLDAYREVKKYTDEAAEKNIAHPSFFEFIFLMAVLYFKKMGAEYVVLETGMGGRLDATNVVAPVLAIITSIGFDHGQFLGNTIKEIASEKAGIMKKGIPVIYFDRKDEAAEVMIDYSKKIGADLLLVEKKQSKILKFTKKTIDFSFDSGYHKYDELKIHKTALYQIENAMLAVKAYEILIMQTRVQDCISNDCISNHEDSLVTFQDIDYIKAGLSEMTWPCRMEEIAPHIYVDGAHNEEAIEAFCESIKVLFPDERKILLFAVSKDKDYESMIRHLAKISFEEIILVRYQNDRSAKTDTVEVTFRHFSSGKITAFDNIRAGFQYAKSHVEENRFLFCVGSLYLAGDLLKIGV